MGHHLELHYLGLGRGRLLSRITAGGASTPATKERAGKSPALWNFFSRAVRKETRAAAMSIQPRSPRTLPSIAAAQPLEVGKQRHGGARIVPLRRRHTGCRRHFFFQIE